MANTRDDMDRIGNRNTPQGSTPQSPQGRDDMNRDREQGTNTPSQGRTDDESFNRDELERDRTPEPDRSRDIGRDSSDIEE